VTGPLEIVQVTTKNGTVIRGVLREQGANGMILTSAQIQSQDQNGRVMFIKMDGDVVIPTDNVDYYQAALPAALLGIE
jgi:small nuclear ribonucleoprotein (snRNP)-like protein